MGTPLFHVDAFTQRPFGGNPAAVCVLAEARPDEWMQDVARELNLSETAFLRRGSEAWHLRWMTPTVEVDLCGHATLASAHVLWEAGYEPADATVAFDTKSGRLSARRGPEGGPPIELDFPAEAATAAKPPSGLLPALGVVSALWTGQNRLDWLVEVGDEPAVRRLAPDFRGLAEACGGARGVIVTARSANPERHFVSRYFAPAAGIDEDPVTGSAHCCLGPFWGNRLALRELKGYQASARGGSVAVRLAEDRVFLGGHAVTVARGELV